MTLKCNTDCCHSFCKFCNMPERMARMIIESNSNPKKTPQSESVETIIDELF